MRWIHKLSKANIPFVIYKLNHQDSLIYYELYDSQKIFIIIHGLINVTHVYNNNIIIPLTTLYTGNILFIIQSLFPVQAYYKYTAITQTYIISFSKHILGTLYKKNSLYIDILNAYQLTLRQYTMMRHIFIEKEIKYKLVQFIIFLCIEFGITQKTCIYVPFSIKQKELAIILNSNRITINKIIHELSKSLLIRYTKNKIIYITNIYIFRYYSYLMR